MNPSPNEPIEERVVMMSTRIGKTHALALMLGVDRETLETQKPSGDFFAQLRRALDPGVFGFTIDKAGYYKVAVEAPPYDGPPNRQGRRAHERRMRKLGYEPAVVRQVEAGVAP